MYDIHKHYDASLTPEEFLLIKRNIEGAIGAGNTVKRIDLIRDGTRKGVTVAVRGLDLVDPTYLQGLLGAIGHDAELVPEETGPARIAA